MSYRKIGRIIRLLSGAMPHGDADYSMSFLTSFKM